MPEPRVRKYDDEAAERASNRRLAKFGLLLVFTVVCVLIYADRGTTEYDVYGLAAERLLSGESLYRLQDAAPPFAYPPLFALATTPILAAPDGWERAAWSSILALLAAGLFIIIGRCVETLLPSAHEARQRTIFWVVTIAVSARYVMSSLENQSHDLFIAVLVAACTWAAIRRRDATSGALVGIAAALKATPLLFLPMFAVQKRWRAVTGMIVALIAGLAATDIVLPRDDGDWNIAEWSEFSFTAARPGRSGGDEVWSAWNHMNQNLSGTMYRLFTPPPSGKDVANVAVASVSPGVRSALISAGQVAVLGLVTFGVWRSHRIRKGRTDAAQFHLIDAGLIACGMILLSPMTSKSHYCTLTIAVAALAISFARHPRRGMGIILAAVFLLNTMTAKGVVGKAAGDTLLAAGTSTWSCVLLLGGLLALLIAPPETRVS